MTRVSNPNDRRLKANGGGSQMKRVAEQFQQATRRTADESIFVDDDTRINNDRVSMQRSGYGKMPVYKLTPTGCTRIEVNAQSYLEVLGNQNYSDVCFDCSRSDCMYETSIKGEIPTNECEGKPPKMFRVCPEQMCSKRIYDPKPTGAYLKDEFDHSDRSASDANRIDDSGDYESSPAQRTKVLMDMHIVGFHPAKAMELGIGGRPELPRMAVV